MHPSLSAGNKDREELSPATPSLACTCPRTLGGTKTRMSGATSQGVEPRLSQSRHGPSVKGDRPPAWSKLRTSLAPQHWAKD
ncbi:uncharacterized protein UV8b_07064 [Ustilaginoidea virens]|uniref:Uncharacterized protein n=1 Tax=Ustilaginoidea virens TaxID=1159556 RepID=A0A8E5HWW9_USTVR|nr:uncharacterized protein UV8b_07064 [Ustilaginoidea virens]QUC22823.1 hypothetical protein UV8b_07064 [Ustilaginoidea virens]